jgi:hypothetical protein
MAPRSYTRLFSEKKANLNASCLSLLYENFIVTIQDFDQKLFYMIIYTFFVMLRESVHVSFILPLYIRKY